MDEAPGAEQDALASQKWETTVMSKHGIKQFRPPFASCKCGGWQLSCPEGMGVIRQRDYILDEFLKHRSAMRVARRRIIDVRKAAKVKA